MQAKDGVSQEIDHCAAGAAGNERTELRILDGTNDHFHARPDHSLHQGGCHVGTETAREVRIGATKLDFVRNAETYCAPFGLVQQRRS